MRVCMCCSGERREINTLLRGLDNPCPIASPLRKFRHTEGRLPFYAITSLKKLRNELFFISATVAAAARDGLYYIFKRYPGGGNLSAVCLFTQKRAAKV